MNREGKSSMGRYSRVVMAEASSLNKLIATRSRSLGWVQRYILTLLQKESCGNFQGTGQTRTHLSLSPHVQQKLFWTKAVTALAVVQVPVSPKYTLSSVGTKA